MNLTLKSGCVVFINILFCNNIGLGHDVDVHKGITTQAAYTAYNNSDGFFNFINVIAPDQLLSSATNSMVDGSAHEDDPPNNQSPDPTDGGGYRSLNHFYDPVYANYGRGLSDSPILLILGGDSRQLLGTNSFAWASISNCVGIKTYLYSQYPRNSYSWQNARYYEWLGLTEPNQVGRQTNLDTMFRAVGQVMHLLEDTSQPQHVRNEQHVDKLGKLFWESPIEDWGNDNLANLNYGDGSMLNWQVAGFSKLEDFWDRHIYASGGGTALLNAEDGGPQLGLAEWTSGNFLGDRHLFPEYFRTTDIEYYPFPSRAYSTDYNDVRLHPGGHIRAESLKNGKQGNGIYLNKTGYGVTYYDIARVNYLGAKLPNAGLKGVPYCTIRDGNVLSNYHNIFIPKAVEYSAGLIDYYFRGMISADIVGYDTNLMQYTNQIYNASSQDFGTGTFFLYGDDTTGSRTLLGQTNLSGVLHPGYLQSMTFPRPAHTVTNYVCFFQGNIGIDGSGNPLDSVDAGIGIAATSFQLCSNGVQNLTWTTNFGDSSLSGSMVGGSGTLTFTGGGINDGSPATYQSSILCSTESYQLTLSAAYDTTYLPLNGLGEKFTYVYLYNADGTLAWESTMSGGDYVGTDESQVTIPLSFGSYYIVFTTWVNLYYGGAGSIAYSLSPLTQP